MVLPSLRTEKSCLLFPHQYTSTQQQEQVNKYNIFVFDSVVSAVLLRIVCCTSPTFSSSALTTLCITSGNAVPSGPNSRVCAPLELPLFPPQHRPLRESLFLLLLRVNPQIERCNKGTLRKAPLRCASDNSAADMIARATVPRESNPRRLM